MQNVKRWLGFAMVFAAGCTTGDAPPASVSTPVDIASSPTEGRHIDLVEVAGLVGAEKYAELEEFAGPLDAPTFALGAIGQVSTVEDGSGSYIQLNASDTSIPYDVHCLLNRSFVRCSPSATGYLGEIPPRSAGVFPVEIEADDARDEVVLIFHGRSDFRRPGTGVSSAAIHGRSSGSSSEAQLAVVRVPPNPLPCGHPAAETSGQDLRLTIGGCIGGGSWTVIAFDGNGGLTVLGDATARSAEPIGMTFDDLHPTEAVIQIATIGTSGDTGDATSVQWSSWRRLPTR